MEWYFADGDEQRGPISETEFFDLVRTGVVRADTLVWCETMPDWRPYGEVAAQAAPAYDMGGARPMYGHEPVGETEPLAIASLVLSVLSCACGIAAIAGVVCGHMALARIRDSQGRKTGSGLAMAGLIIGYIVLILSALGILLQILAIGVGTI
jgi:hypothetical protein